MYVSLYQAFLKTQEEYEFYTPPQLDTYLELETRFEDNVHYALKYGRAKYLEDGPDTLDHWVWETLEYFTAHY